MTLTPPGGPRPRGPATRPLPRFNRIPTGEHIASEHPDRPFTSTLCAVLLHRQGRGELKAVLGALARAISNRTFTVFFDQDEAECLFVREVLTPCRYNSPADLKEIKDWRDLVYNVGAGFYSNAQQVRKKETVASDGRTRIPTDPEMRTEAEQDVALGKRQMKILEDWLFYHQDVLQQLIASS